MHAHFFYNSFLAPFPDFVQYSDKKSADAEAKQAAKKAAAKAEAEKRNRAIAAALTKEAGYRKVVYLGEGKFMIDYAIKGVLTHGFNWPYNLDGEVIFPFVSIELQACLKQTHDRAIDNLDGHPDGVVSFDLDGVESLSR